MTCQVHVRWLTGAVALVIAAACDGGGTAKPVIAVDAGAPHTQGNDATDAAARDSSGASDASPGDASAGDAGAGDASAGDAGTPLPEVLSATGLYAAGSTTQLAEGVMPYVPRYGLWSDGADKQRWLYLPPGTQIDTRDMDQWTFPVGTKVWKEFSVAGKRLETRLLWKTDHGWFRMGFAWNQDGSEALAVTRGAKDIAGTTHDIPSRVACGECHSTSRDMLLGISAIQLSHDQAGVNLKQLAKDGLLTHAPSADFRLPDTTEWNALGYLHANCGNCHNPKTVAWDRVNLDLWLGVGELSAASTTHSYKSTVQALLTDTGGGLKYRVASGDPDQSGLILRMTMRGSDKAMPPIASEIVDPDGVALIRGWIEGL